MTKTTPTIERYGDTVVVVARNAEEAQRAATDALGASCTVTAVERVRSGGVGGFFATEMVRLTASRPGTPRPAATPTALFTGSDTEMEAVLASAEDLVASLNRRTSGFAERLLDEIGASVDAATPVPSPVVDDPATIDRDRIAALAELLHRAETRPETAVAAITVPEPPVTLVPAAPVVAAVPVAPVVASVPTATKGRSNGWSAQALRVIGVPDAVVDAVVAQQPVDEVEWLVALMQALRPLCAAPRPGSTLLVGPACANLARQLRFMSITAEDLPETISSVAVPHITARDLASCDDRVVHLVVGGSWRHLATVAVGIVSAASPDDLIDALRTAAAWGATLGWIWTGERYERIDPFDVAGRIRDAISAASPSHATAAAPVAPRLSNEPDDGDNDPIDRIPVR